MKKTFVLLLILCSYFSNAQNNKQRFDEAVNYIICVCLNDVAKTQKDCNNEDYYQESDFQDKSNNNVNYLLFLEFQKLKEENIAEEKVKSFLSDDIFKSEKYKKIKAFAENEKRSEKIGDLKEEILKYLNGVYPSISEVEIIEKKDINTNVSLAQSIQKSENSTPSFFSLNFWTIVFILLFIVNFFILYKLAKWINDIENKLESNEKKESHSINTQSYSQNQSPYNIDKLEEKISKINNRLEKLEFTNISNSESSAVENHKEIILKPEPPVKEPEVIVFYMATPNAENTFDVRSKSDSFLPTRSLYKFFINSSGNKATFEFHSDESGIKESANSPHIYIEPVCEPQNAQNHNAKKIITIEKGTAENQGDKWHVIKKAKIKYE